MLRRAKRFIEVRLTSPDLDVEALCQGLGASLRTLYRMFQYDGGVQHYIQLKRLDRIWACRTDASETRRISDIAAEFGFLRNDHFARAFRQRFGQSPRDCVNCRFERRAAQLDRASDIGREAWGRWLDPRPGSLTADLPREPAPSMDTEVQAS